MTFKPDNTQNSFLTTAETFPEDDSQFLIKLTSLYTDIANAVNIREIAQYENAEVLTGQQYFTQGNNQTKRYVFRKVFSIGAIASGATSTVAHGIAGLVLPVHIYGVATTDVVDWRPIPCPGACNGRCAGTQCSRLSR